MHDDCYFYLYSDCKLKERCRYRHNPLSKDHLILCKIWSKNKKCRLDCPLRHSLYHVVKQRSDTMCYWEDKGGCTKYRCEYKHLDASKDDWKEPKVKLLAEIIENREKLNATPILDSYKEHNSLNEEVVKISSIGTENIKTFELSNKNNNNINNDLNSTVSIETPKQKVNEDVTISDVLLEPESSILLTKSTNIIDKNDLSHTIGNDINSKFNKNPIDNVNKEDEKQEIILKQENLSCNQIDDEPKKEIRLNSSENQIKEKRKYFDCVFVHELTNAKKHKTEFIDIDIENLDKEIEDLDNLLNL